MIAFSIASWVNVAGNSFVQNGENFVIQAARV
jgi:hypothetical protein